MPGQEETMFLLLTFLWGMNLSECFGPECALKSGGGQ